MRKALGLRSDAQPDEIVTGEERMPLRWYSRKDSRWLVYRYANLFATILVCLLLSAAVVACINPFQNAKEKAEDVAGDTAGDTGDESTGEGLRYGTIVINPEGALQASTIMPDLGNLGELAHRRRVEFVHTGPGTPGSLARDPVESYEDGDPIADIPYGTWTITMLCYDEEEVLIATGTTPGVIVNAATVPVTILITPLSGGSGTLLYTVEFPAEMVTDVVVTLDPWPIGGDDDFVLVAGADPTSNTEVDYNADFATTGTLGIHATLDSGAYLMTIQFSDSATAGDGLHAPLVDIVQIYDNLESSAPTVVLTADQLRSVPDAPSGLQVNRVGPDAPLATIALTWTDNSNTEEGSRIYRDSVLIGTVGPGITTFQDGGVGEGFYSYSVAAYNAFGESPETDPAATAMVCLLAYEGNGSTGGTAPATVAYLSGETVTVAAQGDLVREGHTFEGWNTQADGEGTDHPPGTSVAITESMTLHARWEIITYTLTYTAGANGTIDGDTSQNVNHGGSGTAVTANPAVGYRFIEWSDGVMAAERIDTNVTGNINVTATFAINQYTVTYDGNGSNGGDVPAAVTYDFGDTVTVSDSGTMTRTGYSFDRWNTAADGSETSYQPGNTFPMPAENVTLYAQWTPVNWLMVSGGNFHTVAIHEDGSLWAWGNNTAGQIGDGTQDHRGVPVQVSGGGVYTHVAAGAHHSLAVGDDGTIWAWGDNLSGQLGDGSIQRRLTPVQVVIPGVFTHVVAGSNHSLALMNNGTIWAWGNNTYGQLGDGTTQMRPTPVQVSAGGVYIHVAAGADHSLALRDDGTIGAWGANNYGQLGNGTTTQNNTPVQVSGGGIYNQVAAGAYHSLAIRNDGTLWVWGNNTYGQLGNGSTINRNTPVQVTGGGGLFTQVSAGGGHTLAIVDTTTLWAWGENTAGQLGDGTTQQRLTPVNIAGGLVYAKVAAGNGHSLAVTDTGMLYAWGLNDSGQLGDGTIDNKLTPTLIE
jgi:uncharacterized repeat protein (TIGR02543 family)